MALQHLFGRYPFPSEDKRPLHIRGEGIHHFIYPPSSPHYSDLNELYCSTDKLTMVIFQLGPGGVFDPPDYHAGDEVYFILEGTLTEGNPPLGQFVQVRQGDFLLLPKPVWHKGYNFEQTPARMLAIIAPRIWDEGLPPTEFRPEMSRTFLGAYNDRRRPLGPLDGPHRPGTVDDLGRWPLSGPASRADPLLMYPIGEGDKLILVHGDQYPMLVKVAVSNDYLHVGEFILPAGGISSRACEPLAHAGDAALYVQRGPITFYLPDTQEAFHVAPAEAMFIPQGVRYQMINYTADTAQAIFAIAPGI